MAVDVRSALVELIRDELGWEDTLPVGPLVEVLDSVRRLSLVVAIEDHFQICLEPEDEERIETIEDLIRMIEEKVLS